EREKGLNLSVHRLPALAGLLGDVTSPVDPSRGSVPEPYQFGSAFGSGMTHEIKRTYRYRIYPNEAQRAELARTFGCSRWVYNWALETKTKAYYQDEETLSLTDLSGRLTDKKREEETEWLLEVSAVTLQQSLRNLNQAFTNFFEGRAEYPSFKSKKGDQTARYVGTAFGLSRRERETEAPPLEDAGSDQHPVVERASVRAK
uniref:RNA-guided endonuclease InsQ/TnpB family protein n=2 Tax=Salinibacter ruber TaxID=146919 RepID=UPI0020740422